MKILFFTTDLPPILGVPTNGTSLRAAGFIAGFNALGHEVVVSTPRSAIESFKKTTAFEGSSKEIKIALDRLAELSFCNRTQSAIVARIKPDIIFCGHWPAVMFSTKPRQPLIVDLAGPHLLERHFQGSQNHDAAVVAKLNTLSMADLCVVSGPSQRRYFLSFLMRTGMDRPEERLVEIPMAYADPPLFRTPRQDSSNYPRIIFGGVFLPWQDPSFALRKTVEVLERRGKGRLILVGGPHPSYDIDSGIYKQLFEDLSQSKFVEAHPMLPLADFTAKLREADVALDLMGWNLERELAVTIRTTSYLWSGLPVIYNEFADLGQTITRYGAGWAAAPNELDAILNQIIDDPEDLAHRASAATKLATELFNAKDHCRRLLERAGIGSTYKEELDITLDFPQLTDLPVTPDCPVTQRFVCRVDRLAEVRIRVHLDEDYKASQIRLSVNVENDDGPVLIAANTFPITASTASDWIRLRFDPVADSAGRTFSLTVEQLDRNPVLTPAVYPWSVQDSPYPLLSMTAMGETYTDRALCMQTISVG